jgi:hypothetical protein
MDTGNPADLERKLLNLELEALAKTMKKWVSIEPDQKYFDRINFTQIRRIGECPIWRKIFNPELHSKTD